MGGTIIILTVKRQSLEYLRRVNGFKKCNHENNDYFLNSTYQKNLRMTTLYYQSNFILANLHKIVTTLSKHMVHDMHSACTLCDVDLFFSAEFKEIFFENYRKLVVFCVLISHFPILYKITCIFIGRKSKV